MGPISVTAEAGLDIIKKLAAGELEVHGILLRDTDGKKFRYILRGFENLPNDANKLTDLPPLEHLRAAISMTQVLQIVSIAQNIAIAVSLRRIDARLEEIEQRLADIVARLARIETKATLVLDALHSMPVSRLKAAKAAAIVAHQHGDRTAMIVAGKDAQQAYYDLMEQAYHLVRLENDGLPVALDVPLELADLSKSAAAAAFLASWIWLALDNKHNAAAVMRESADRLRSIRGKLHRVFSDQELLLRRMKTDKGLDGELLEAGRRLAIAEQVSIGRALMLEQKQIVADKNQFLLERVTPAEEPSFLPIPDQERHAS